MRNVKRFARSDAGQATVLFALLSTAIIGAAAIVVDVGRAYIVRARAENAMTAAVLAAARSLPADPAQALAEAQSMGALNGFPQATYHVACGGTCVEGLVSTRDPSVLAQILGVDSLSVSAAAAAARAQNAVTTYQTPGAGTATPANGYTFFSSVAPGFGQPGAWGTATSGPSPAPSGDASTGYQTFAYNPNDVGQAGLLPFDVTVETATTTPLYTTISLKVGAGDATEGNFGAVRIDGPGAATYRHDIIYGASSPVSVGEVLTTQPGDVVGPTNQGMAQRSADFANGDPDLAVVPVVQPSSGGGATQVTVAGFAAVLLSAYTPGTGTESGEVSAEFVGAFLPSTSSAVPTIATGVWGGSPYLLLPGSVTGTATASSDG